MVVTSFRTAESKDKARLVFELSGKPDYVLFSLINPDRLVLDIKNANLAIGLGHSPVPAYVKDFRTSHHNQYFRIVMDLTRPINPHSFMFAGNAGHYRLVMDLVPTTALNPIVMKNTAMTAKSNVVIAPVLPLPTRISTPTPIVVANPAIRAKPRNIIVVVDPGHGGKDPGTTGPNGTHEKNVVLAISKDLARLLNHEPGFHAELTRTGDYYITLRGRLAIARKDKADMFIAIHADAYKYKDATGASVFALSERGATSEAARWLAERENKSELLGGASLPNKDNVLRSVLIDLSQTNTISESLQIGASVLRQLSNVTVLHHDRVEQAAFVVLKSPDIPSILVETGFLSNPQQERQLTNPQYQEKLAVAMMQGIKSYFMRNPPPGTLFALERHQRDKDKYALLQRE